MNSSTSLVWAAPPARGSCTPEPRAVVTDLAAPAVSVIETGAERWLPVVGWEDAYSVSTQGRVLSMPRRVVRSDGLVLNLRGKILTESVRNGYALVALSRNRTYFKSVHRLVLEAFVGPCPPGMEGCHKNGNSMDNSLENLRWDTSSNNNFDQIKHGTHYSSSKTHCPRGHLLESPNLIVYFTKRGRARNCLACNRVRASNYYRRDRGLPLLDFQVASDQKYDEIMQAA